MDESLPLHDDETTAQCPVPSWAAWPIAVGLPLLAVIVLVWFVFFR